MGTGVVHVWPQPLEQHFSPSLHSESESHVCTHMPATPSSTGGQEKYWASAEGVRGLGGEGGRVACAHLSTVHRSTQLQREISCR